MTDSRRDFLKKTAVAGGLVWAAPVISTVAAKPAGAGPGSPCACHGTGTGLYGTITEGGVTSPVGPFGQSSGAQSCAGSIVVGGPPALPALIASNACGSFTTPSCTAMASLSAFSLLPTGVSNIASRVSAQGVKSQLTAATNGPAPCNNGSVSVIIGSLIVGAATVVVPPAKPSGHTVTSGNTTVVIDERCCDPAGDSVVRALHVTLAPTTVNGILTSADLIVAESKAGTAAGCCPCSFGVSC